ncbi:WxL domain-containing protein [Latilactobacillus fuchuensis]|uniref:WxL domain-containing protein n=1 Tax=Latilactobacillus fuchuensis TaxID=164393 RepID=UPI001F236FE6|nr:WxL domain-containing protein [Latilactobacillus fuchuensis]
MQTGQQAIRHRNSHENWPRRNCRSFKDNVGLTLNNQNKDVNIVTAEDGEGQGANVFGWTPSNIKLTMPTGAAVSNATYQANLTWTLASTAV